ncbi:MAG: porin family protein [Gemmatimonadales bacterium]
MKKIVVVGFAMTLCLTAAASARAQVGLAAGGIMSDASVKVSDSDVETESLTRLSAGAYYATGKTFGLIFGGYYTQKGFGVVGSETEVKPAYIEIPVMGVVRLPVVGRTIGPRLYGGANFGIEVSCDTSGSLSELPGFSCDETNSFDFGLKAGLGVQVLFLGLDLSYVHGLTDIAKQDEISIKNRTWSLALLLGIG